jgi:zinc protease
MSSNRNGATPRIEQLSSGMRLMAIPSEANNIVSLVCFLPVPGAIERPEEAGLVSFTQQMLVRGTKTRTNAELAEAIESLGTSLDCNASSDFSDAHIVCTRDTFDASLDLLADVLQNPSFEPEEVEKERQTTIAEIRSQEDDKAAFTLKHFSLELYGQHSYGLPRIGFVETVNEFRREQLTHVHSEMFDPSQYLVVCVGNFDPERLRTRLVELFAPRATPAEPFVVPDVVPGAAHRKALSRECEQAFVAVGFPACAMASADYYPLRVLSAVLGESMSSRFFVRLRDEQGLAYATGCRYSGLRKGGHLVGFIGTKPESLDVAREGMIVEFGKVKDALVDADELERARNYLIGRFLIDHQTNYRRAHYLGYFETMGLGAAMDAEYSDRIAAVTAEQVREVAQKYITDPTIVELVPTKES